MTIKARSPLKLHQLFRCNPDLICLEDKLMGGGVPGPMPTPSRKLGRELPLSEQRFAEQLARFAAAPPQLGPTRRRGCTTGPIRAHASATSSTLGEIYTTSREMAKHAQA